MSVEVKVVRISLLSFEQLENRATANKTAIFNKVFVFISG
jgi:hypothetical protein